MVGRMLDLTQKALATAAGSCIVLDAGLRIVSATEAANRLLGVDVPEGVAAAKFLCGNSTERPIAEALTEGRPTRAMIEVADGRGVEVRAQPMLDGEAIVGWLLFLRDLHIDSGEIVEYEGMMTRSSAMKLLFAQIERVAPRDSTILIRGESGTGKELVARAIHARSSRQYGPFVALNCAALPPHLLESELFGHVRGAFTGAVKDFPGRFRLAEGGTIFLDEVAELPLALQAKLLRVLQERSVIPIGGREAVPVDVRIVSATHRSLRQAVAEGVFREDLMYRIRVIPLFLPPLREREEDVTLLANHFVDRFRVKGEENLQGIAESALSRLDDYSWPGNIRELQNVLEYAVAMRDGAMLCESDLPPEIRGEEPGPMRLNKTASAGESETRRVARALERAAGHRGRAAEMLGISRATLWRRMRVLGLLDDEPQH